LIWVAFREGPPEAADFLSIRLGGANAIAGEKDRIWRQKRAAGISAGNVILWRSSDTGDQRRYHPAVMGWICKKICQ